MFLTSDNDVHFISGANVWANRIDHVLGNVGLDTQPPNLVKGTAPASDTYTHLFLCEKSGTASKNRLAGVEAWASVVGTTSAYLRAYKSEAGSVESAWIAVKKNKNGDEYFQLSSSPISSSDSTDIATTEWVKDRDAEVESNLVTALNNLAKTWG